MSCATEISRVLAKNLHSSEVWELSSVVKVGEVIPVIIVGVRSGEAVQCSKFRATYTVYVDLCKAFNSVHRVDGIAEIHIGCQQSSAEVTQTLVEDTECKDATYRWRPVVCGTGGAETLASRSQNFKSQISQSFHKKSHNRHVRCDIFSQHASLFDYAFLKSMTAVK